jgi:hypothetical protein
MSVTPRTITAAQLTTAAAVYYTAPANTKSLIKKLTFTNTTTGALTVTVYLVPNGGTPGATNILISAQPIAAGETWECFAAEGQVLQVGGTLQALASAATSITIQGAIAEVV